MSRIWNIKVISMLSVCFVLTAGCASVRSSRQGFYSRFHAAAFRGNVKQLELHLNMGADVNARGDDSLRAIHAAAAGGHPDAVTLLIERGAAMDVLTQNQETPLSLAAAAGHRDVVMVLLKAGLSPDSGNALYQAAAKGHPAVVQALLEHGANPNTHAASRMTPLHAAVAKDHMDITRLLLKHGADPDLAGKAMDAVVTPRDIAIAMNNHSQLALLSGNHENATPTATSTPARESTATVKPGAAPEGVTAATAAETPPPAKQSDSSGTDIPSLATLDAEIIRELGRRAIMRFDPAIDMRLYSPGYIIYMEHDLAGLRGRIIAEWIGRDPVEGKRGTTYAKDRIRVRKLRVFMQGDGEIIDVMESHTWLARKMKAAKE